MINKIFAFIYRNLDKIIIFLRKNHQVLFLAMVFLIYLFILRGLPGNLHPNGIGAEKIDVTSPPFESSLERGRYAQIISLANKFSFNIDEYSDFVKPDTAWYNGHYYPAFPPGVALLAVPAYLLGRVFGLSQIFSYLTITFFSIATGFVILQIAKKINLSNRAAIFSLFSYGFASVALAYSITLSAHPVSAFLISLSFFLCMLIDKGRSNFFILSAIWFIYGLNFFIDYPNLFILLPILIFSIIRTFTFYSDAKSILLKIPFNIFYSSIPLILLLGLFMVFNLYHFNKPIAFTNTFNLRVIEREGISIAAENLSNDIFSKKPYSARFNPQSLYRGINVLLISHDRGLFIYSPIFLLSIAGLLILWRKKQAIGFIILLTFIANILVYGSFDDPWGGWGFGPRYLIPTLPLIAILVGVSFDNLFKKGFLIKMIISLLWLYSSAIALIGALTTNAVPPSVEAVSLNMPDNFILNWNYLLSGKTSSFIYNSFLKNTVTPLSYFIFIFVAISVVGLSIIWFPGRKVKE